MKIQLYRIAHGRSGDKGDTVNVGVRALRPEFYPFLRDHLTVERVKQHFGDMVKGSVDRFELPNLYALNFLLHGALGGLPWILQLPGILLVLYPPGGEHFLCVGLFHN